MDASTQTEHKVYLCDIPALKPYKVKIDETFDDDELDTMEEKLMELNIENYDDFCNFIVENLFSYVDDYNQQHIQDFKLMKYDELLKVFIQSHISRQIQMFYDENIHIGAIYHIGLDEIKEHIYTIFCDMYETTHISMFPPRSMTTSTNNYHSQSLDVMKERLDIVDKKDEEQPEQRTPEWYVRRHNLLSASDIWKTLGSQAQQNDIIYRKCSPINTQKYSKVNMNSSLHWGQKYEPVSQLYYEYMYKCKIREYGCIPHSTYDFLGASPDGIVVESQENPQLVGRMLEIKNVVSRNITGIPKLEYWVQTQLQMECCDLEECDFLECKFSEYESFDAFMEDTHDTGLFHKTEDDKYKGVFICFMNKEQHPVYEYPPFDIENEAEFNKWNDEMIDKHNALGNNWIQNVCWKLDVVSCVLIPRNRQWFAAVFPQFKTIWETIVKERETGYEHRAPRRRYGSKTNQLSSSSNTSSSTNKIQKPFIPTIRINI